MSDYNGFQGLDLSGVSEGPQRKTMPAGNHIVSVKEARVMDAKSGGKFVYVRFENDDGQYVEERMNIVNKSEKAVEIGKRKLKEMLVCADHPNPDKPGDIKTLIGLKLGVRIQIGESWSDDNGDVRPGGGELRPNAPFFRQTDNVSIGEAPKDEQLFNAPPKETPKEDDNIPF